MNLLLIIPSISTAITVFAPFRWVWRFWLLFSIIIITLIAVSPTDPDSGIGHALGLSILLTYLVLSGLLLLSRTAFHILHARWKLMASSPGNREAAAIYVADLMVCVTGSCTAAVFAVIILGRIFASQSHGVFIHATVLLLTIGALFCILRSSRLRHTKHLRVLAFTLPGLSILAVATVLSVLYPIRVLAEAQETTSGNPYCIEMSSRDRDLQSWQDIMFFTMDKDMGPHGGHHAILLVDRDGEIEPFHWCYRSGKFLSGVVNWNNKNRLPVACKPKTDFGPALGLTFPRDPAFKELYFQGKHLRIQNSYQPSWTNAYLSIAAIVPDFPPTERVAGGPYASMAIRGRTWLQNLAGRSVPDLLPGHTSALIEARDGKYGDQIFYRTNGSGEILTLVNCYDSRPIEIRCQHRFYRDGRMYSFDHSRELLGQSHQMEERLIQVFSSFETE